MQGLQHAPPTTKQQLDRNTKKYKHWGHDVFVWSESEVQHLIESGFPEYKAWYNSILNIIQRCDVARAFILLSYGGLYTDIDFDPLIDPKLMNETEVIVGTDDLMGANNAWIYSPPNHKFWLTHFIPYAQQQLIGPKLIDTFLSMVVPTWSVISSTGPQAYWTLRHNLLMDPNVFKTYGIHGAGSSPTWFNKYKCTQQQSIVLVLLILSIFGLWTLLMAVSPRVKV
jgi:mannosyltransferase OCH1-like enzyme